MVTLGAAITPEGKLCGRHVTSASIFGGDRVGWLQGQLVGLQKVLVLFLPCKVNVVKRLEESKESSEACRIHDCTRLWNRTSSVGRRWFCCSTTASIACWCCFFRQLAAVDKDAGDTGGDQEAHQGGGNEVG